MGLGASVARGAGETGAGEIGRTQVATEILRPIAAEPAKFIPTSVSVIAVLVVLALVGLPVAVWLDLRNLSERALMSQAADFQAAIDSMRNFYAQNVVGRVLQAHGQTRVVENYQDVPGAIPLPATLSIELGRVLGSQDGNMRYEFISDYPFARRSPHKFDGFESDALTALRQNPKQVVFDVSGSLFDRRVRLATPVIMGGPCVSCHNTHPDSPKRDWKVGDVRGLQEFDIRRPIAANIFAFQYLLIYLVGAATIGLAVVVAQHRQASVIRRMNRRLEESNEFLAGVSKKIAKYLSPQLFRAVFEGEKDVVIATERKKLTVFFSDIVNFTVATERLQPEELTALLNEYLTEMSDIAIRHGGTVDKFIGDAILVFFGDPETKGVTEDAKACMAMALEMRRRIAELNAQWRRRGVEQPFRVRMGINTGFCNVGNFGSNDRMDYTIIGADANLAARLQSSAEPGEIVISYETYALVRDMVRGRPLAPITLKGISRTIVPYVVEGLIDRDGQRTQVISEHATGLEIFLDAEVVAEETVDHIRRVLQDALAALEVRRPSPAE
jgi:class 3 adenylate cyclase/type II secretory pathway pseudopilin PulG